MPNIVDRFNVEGQEYYLEPPMDAVPTQGSHNAVQSGGVYDALAGIAISPTPAQGETKAFSTGGAYDYFQTANSKEWLRKVFGKSIGIRWAQGTVSDGATLGALPTVNTEDGVFFTIPTYGPAHVYVSFNGKDWQPTDIEQNSSSAWYVRNAIRFKGLYILSMMGLSGAQRDKLYWSENGINWTQISFTGRVYQMYSNGDVLVISGGGIYYSEDGKNFSACTSSGGGAYSSGEYCITYGNGIFMFINGDNYPMAVGVSTDGKVFTGVSISATYAYGRGIAFGENIWRAYFGGGRVYRSTDNGASWTQELTSPADTDTSTIMAYCLGSGITYAHGQWFIYSKGKAQVGTSNRDWVDTTVAGRAAGYSPKIKYMDGLYIAPQADGVATSLDGYSFIHSDITTLLYSYSVVGCNPGILVFGSYYSSVDDMNCV